MTLKNSFQSHIRVAVVALFMVLCLSSCDAESKGFKPTWTAFIGVDESALDEETLSSIPETIAGVMPVEIESKDNVIDIAKAAGYYKEKAAALLYTEIGSPGDMEVEVGAAADWWMEWYVNGEKVYTTLPAGNRYIDFIVFDHRFKLPLKKGRNVIAVKVLSGAAGWRLVAADEDTLKEMERKLQDAPLTAIVNEDDIPPYTLPEILTANDGSKITTKEEWETKRRKEILAGLEDEVFGHIPQHYESISYALVSNEMYNADADAFVKTVNITVSNAGKAITFPIDIFYPTGGKKAKGIFIYINHRGNDKIKNPNGGIVPMRYVVGRGYAVVSLNVRNVALDNKELYKDGVLQLYPEYFGKENAWKTISAWAWAVMRTVDYIYTDSAFDNDKIAVIGHSRGGKTSIWVGANDERIAFTCVNNGDSPMRRLVGQKVDKTITIFPHWFNDNFNKYAFNEDKLPVDNHMQYALIAPRAVHSGIAAYDINSDPKGIQLSMLTVNPVYKLYGMKGLPNTEPKGDSAVFGDGMAYHVVIGRHNMTELDWGFYLDHADNLFK